MESVCSVWRNAVFGIILLIDWLREAMVRCRSASFKYDNKWMYQQIWTSGNCILVEKYETYLLGWALVSFFRFSSSIRIICGRLRWKSFDSNNKNNTTTQNQRNRIKTIIMTTVCLSEDELSSHTRCVPKCENDVDHWNACKRIRIENLAYRHRDE